MSARWIPASQPPKKPGRYAVIFRTESGCTVESRASYAYGAWGIERSWGTGNEWVVVTHWRPS